MTNRNEQALDRTQRRVEVEYEGERAVPGNDMQNANDLSRWAE